MNYPKRENTKVIKLFLIFKLKKGEIVDYKNALKKKPCHKQKNNQNLDSSDYLECQEQFFKPNCPGVSKEPESFQSSTNFLILNSNKKKIKKNQSQKPRRFLRL